MATEIVYIDSTSGNDLTGVVDDALLPFEHIQAGVNALTIGSDGIVILAPGIYIEDSGGTNYCLLDRSLASLTIAPNANYQSTIRAARSGSQPTVISAQASLNFFSIGRVNIDAEGEQTHHIIFDPSVAMSVIIDGSRFINCGSLVFGQTDYVLSFVMQNEWSIANAPDIFSLTPALNGTQIDISNGYVINSGIDFTATPFFINVSVAHVNVVIDNVRIDYTSTVSASLERHLIFIRGAENIYVANGYFKFDNNGSAASISCITIMPSDIFIPISVVIEDNYLGTSRYSKLNTGIQIGAVSDASSHRIDGVIIRRNFIFNAISAIILGYITSAKSYSNRISNASFACMALGTIRCEYSTNLIIDTVAQSLTAQFDNDSLFANNTCIAQSVSPDGHFYSTYNLFPVTGGSHGTLFINNIVLDFLGDSLLIFSEIDSTAKYQNNNLYQPNGSSTDKYSYDGTLTSSLVTLATLVNGLDPGGMSGNTEIDPEFDPNTFYELQIMSPLVGAGLKWWLPTRSNPIGINGHSFWGAHVDLGANSTWDGLVQVSSLQENLTQRTPSPKRSTDYRTPYIP